MKIETILIIILAIIAFAYIVYRSFLSFKKSQEQCGCGTKCSEKKKE